MHKYTRLIMRILLIVLLSFSVTSILGTGAYTVSVQAAIKAPTLVSGSKTLYVGSNSYKVEFNNLSKNAKTSYKSSNSAIAKVTNSGTISPVKKGSAIITASIKQSNKTYSLKITITVKSPYVNITERVDYMNVKDIAPFKAKAYGLKDKVVWSVSDESVASISKEGELTALSSGNITIYAKAGGKTSKCDVTIGNNRIGTYFTNVICYDKITLWISITDPIESENFVYNTGSISAETFDYEVGEWINNKCPITIIPKSIGIDYIRIKSKSTTDELNIVVNVVKEPSTEMELNAKEIYAKCGPATVEILASDPINGERLGSGFFIDKGFVVTNYHVIEGADNIQVTTQDNKVHPVIYILGYDKKLDIAILFIASKNASLSLGQATAMVGEDIFTLGSPLGLTQTFSAGMVSSASRNYDGVEYIQINAPISPGSSGGPLINVYGEVIGINTMYFEDGQNLNFAINIKELLKINTNHPVSVSEYYEQYMKQLEEYYLDNATYEDPGVSQNPQTCQTINLWSIVDGTVTSRETGDCYRFAINNTTNFVGMIWSKDFGDVKNTYFNLYNYNNVYYATAQERPNELYQTIYYYNLPLGDYYVEVTLPEGYTGDDVPYFFMLGTQNSN